jgi:surface antigen
MPQGVTQALYRDAAGKNSRDFAAIRPFSRWLRVFCVLALPLCGCVELAAPLLDVTKSQKDLFDITGSLADDGQAFSLQMIEDGDRPRALAALGQALDPMNDGQSSGWTSPNGQRRGTFSARGLAFVQDEQLCRDFLALIETRQSAKEVDRQHWSGTACRQDLGAWSVVPRPRLSKNR